MTHPLFRKEIFVETAFERRFQAMLRFAWQRRSWHVIVADPGSGKTMGIRDLVKTAGRNVVLAVVTPKNNDDEQALGDQLYAALGVATKGHWSTRKPKLMGHLHQSGTQCLIVDDAHDLSFQHLMFLKEITDQGRLQYDHPLGLCLVAAARGNIIPLKETLDQPDLTWLQWRRRLDKIQPFCRIAGHTSDEVREILVTLETVYREALPQLNLRRWTSFIYTWLTQPVLDSAHSGRVTMDYLMKLVTTALEAAYSAGETDVRAETLKEAADLLVLRRNTYRVIDRKGPHDLASEHDGPALVHLSETEHEQEASQEHEQQHASQRREPAEEQAETGTSSNCPFSGVIPIDRKRFLESSVVVVECPGCGRTRSLSPNKEGFIRFPPHKTRKRQTSLASKRWAVSDGAGWNVVDK